MGLAVGEMKGWSVVKTDDQNGFILAEATRPLFRIVDDVRVYITLDENAQTRVDLLSQARKGKRDFGTNTRRIARFIQQLDQKLGAAPRYILEPPVAAGLPG